MRRRQHELELQRLLNALDAELLSAPDGEIHRALSQRSRQIDATLREIRSVIQTALAGRDDEDVRPWRGRTGCRDERNERDVTAPSSGSSTTNADPRAGWRH
jgi:hypothetical protein